MSAPVPHEAILLRPVNHVIDVACHKVRKAEIYEYRLQLLEAASARLGGFDITSFNSRFGITPVRPIAETKQAAATIVSVLGRVGIHPAMALSALSREPLDDNARRTSGAHHTDFRLAQLIGRKAAEINVDRRSIIDPACGAGILLVASTLETCGFDRLATAKWLADRVHACDVSASALRGARLALASLTDDLDAITDMVRNWHVGDSLLRDPAAWASDCPGGYGAVVANPPWEKLKVLRHEFDQAAGSLRHYGAAHFEEPSEGLAKKRNDMQSYCRLLAERYPLAANGEIDLFMAFTELLMRLAGAEGAIAALLPAGLIRSQTTMALRQTLMERFSSLHFTVITNKARFFAIDTRFKFLAVSGTVKPHRGQPGIGISYCIADDDICTETLGAHIPLAKLRALRPDLTVPEVRGVGEWKLFMKMARKGVDWSDETSPWHPDFCREVDMTRERKLFRQRPGRDLLPLIEGRMVQQHRFGAKAYVTGTGRRAQWDSLPMGCAAVAPQFWIDRHDLPGRAADRAKTVRAGFCDIAGQTNERSMMAAVIPAGVACGNKVPTVVFPRLDEDALHLWCGMVNSLAFDWLLRRIITTTVNYFLLQSVPLPAIDPKSLPGRRIIEAVKEIAKLDTARGAQGIAWRIAELRGRIDVACFKAYGVDVAEVSMIMNDFLSLDRSQPPLPGERRSTITRDFVIALMNGGDRYNAESRLSQARALGAVPFVPSQNGEDEVSDEQPAYG